MSVPTREINYLKQLNEFAENFLQKHYRIPLVVPIRFNGRIKVTLGRFISDEVWELDGSSTYEVPRVIELSKILLQYYTDTEIESVLSHELVHYALFMLELPCEDGDPYFEKELERLGICSAEDLPYRGKIYIYECSQCGTWLVSEHKINLSTYESVCCGKDFRLKEERFIQTLQEWDELEKECETYP